MNFRQAKKELIRELKENGYYSDCQVGISRTGSDYSVVIAALPNYDPVLNGADDCVMCKPDDYSNTTETVKEIQSWRKKQLFTRG